MRREARITPDVLDNDTLALREHPAADRGFVTAVPEVREKIRLKPLLRDNRQGPSSPVVELDRAEVRALKCHGSGEHFLQNRLQFGFGKQAGAQFVEPVHRGRLGTNSSLVRASDSWANLRNSCSRANTARFSRAISRQVPTRAINSLALKGLTR